MSKSGKLNRVPGSGCQSSVLSVSFSDSCNTYWHWPSSSITCQDADQCLCPVTIINGQWANGHNVDVLEHYHDHHHDDDLLGERALTLSRLLVHKNQWPPHYDRIQSKQSIMAIVTLIHFDGGGGGRGCTRFHSTIVPTFSFCAMLSHHDEQDEMKTSDVYDWKHLKQVIDWTRPMQIRYCVAIVLVVNYWPHRPSPGPGLIKTSPDAHTAAAGMVLVVHLHLRDLPGC